MMLTAALDTIVLIRERTGGGRDAMDKPFTGYSTTPIYISKKAFPKPRGGTPKNKTVFYSGGYKQYKKESRQPGTVGTRKNQRAKKPTAEVDLTRTGLMLNSITPIDYYDRGFSLGFMGPAQKYAVYVNQKTFFMGLSPKDMKIIGKLLKAQVMRRLN